METTRLTMAQAIVKWFVNQHTMVGDEEVEWPSMRSTTPSVSTRLPLAASRRPGGISHNGTPTSIRGGRSRGKPAYAQVIQAVIERAVPSTQLAARRARSRCGGRRS